MNNYGHVHFQLTLNLQNAFLTLCAWKAVLNKTFVNFMQDIIQTTTLIFYISLALVKTVRTVMLTDNLVDCAIDFEPVCGWFYILNVFYTLFLFRTYSLQNSPAILRFLNDAIFRDNTKFTFQWPQTLSLDAGVFYQ